MARLRLMDPDTDPKVAALAERIRSERSGKLLNLYKTLLHSPPFAEGWLNLMSAVRNHSTLDGALRELIILRVAQINEAPYEFDTHRPIAVACGVSEQQLTDLATWDSSSAFTPAQRAVLRLTDVMTRAVHVPDEDFEPVRTHFNEREVVEIAVTVASYNMVSRFLEAVQVDHD